MFLGLGVPRRGLFFCQATGSSPSVGWLRERRMNPKCLGGAVPDTFSAESADSTGLFSMPITRAALRWGARQSAQPPADDGRPDRRAVCAENSDSDVSVMQFADQGMR